MRDSLSRRKCPRRTRTTHIVRQEGSPPRGALFCVKFVAVIELPEGFTTRAPAREDAEVVAALISACQIADTGETDMSVEEMLDDWHSLDLAEEAVIVTAPEGRTAAYADVFNRSFVIVSIYGYVHPDYRGMGLGSYLGELPHPPQRTSPRRRPRHETRGRLVSSYVIKQMFDESALLR